MSLTLWDAAKPMLVILIPAWIIFIFALVKAVSLLKNRSPLRVALVFASIYAGSIVLVYLLYLVTRNNSIMVISMLFYCYLTFPIWVISVATHLNLIILNNVYLGKIFCLPDFANGQHSYLVYIFLIGVVQFFVLGLLIGRLIKIPGLLDKLLAPIKNSNA